MGDLKMDDDGLVRNRIMGEMRAETVTKDDGRYLTYYSWPEDEAELSSQHADETPIPAQKPWSPEAGPADV